MPKLRPKLPWLVAIQLAMEAGRAWQLLPAKDKDKAKALLTKSKGRPSNLTRRERDELKRIARDLDLLGVARTALPMGGGKRRR